MFWGQSRVSRALDMWSNQLEFEAPLWPGCDAGGGACKGDGQQSTLNRGTNGRCGRF